ncbi:hypothetical protein AUJ35_03120 [Candidatus Falkowbacteria bacterium CG1_02_41_21]|uniref:DUF4012 domain-containing protein n=1 Tax=Candidatus Falkowbacteria bacterium CG1_02_41_21 TaxID=1805147 RepID=A0A1J4T531_9BACT|nr:MAG: hypothetical protein AUJ35_03120 [Candidatus Falkowbacteria bacterium CG1_02_41_21]
MAIKRHQVKINVVAGEQLGPDQSSFVVDLKPTSSSFQERSVNPNIVTHSAPVKNSADFLTSDKTKSEFLNFDSVKMKQMLFYPLYRLIYQLVIFSRRVYNQLHLPQIKLPKINWPRLKFPVIKIHRWKFKPEPKIVTATLDLVRKVIPAKILEREEPVSPVKRWRSILFFILILLAIIIPFKLLTYYQILNLKSWQEALIGNSQSGIDSILSASESAVNFNLSEANKNFSAAGADFIKAQAQFKEIDELILALASFSNDEKIKLAAQSQPLLAAGAVSARLGGNLTLALDSLVGSGRMNEPIGPRLENFVLYGRSAISDVKELNQTLKTIKIKSLPVDYQQKFNDLKAKAVILEDGLSNFVNLAVGLDEFLGANMDKRYLLVFQNNNELRASGGFVGSYALVDLRDGQIKNIEVPGGGSYDTEGGLKVLMAAPQPLWLVNPLWHFWDANWWPDWELSAKNLMWFLEKSDGPSVDGVITFTPTVIEKLLTVTGAIDLKEKYGVTITADNFWEVAQSIIEKTGNPEAYASSTDLGKKITAEVKKNEELLAAADKAKPKAIIGDLLSKIMETLPQKLDQANLLKLLKITDESLSAKQIMFYFSDSNLEQKMIENGWAGKMRFAPNDYLSVINTNIAGGKSDRVMEETINHQIEIQADGSIIDNLIITRAHRGVRGEPFTGMRNVDWMRIYVPLGSELLESSGWSVPDQTYFESPDPAWKTNEYLAQTEGQATTQELSGVKVYAENGKTVFANWSMVDPGKNTIITLKYHLPFKLKLQKPATGLIAWVNRLFKQEPIVYDYSLLVQKQPGAPAGNYSSSLSFSGRVRIFWKYPDNLDIIDNGWERQEPLAADKYYKILIK